MECKRGRILKLNQLYSSIYFLVLKNVEIDDEYVYAVRLIKNNNDYIIFNYSLVKFENDDEIYKTKDKFLDSQVDLIIDEMKERTSSNLLNEFNKEKSYKLKRM